MSTWDRRPGGWFPSSTFTQREIHRVLITPALRGGGNLTSQQAFDLIAGLLKSGAIVRSDFYVPSLDELYRRFKHLAYTGRVQPNMVRWVMCAETHEALMERFGDHQTPLMTPLTLSPIAAIGDAPFDTVQTVTRSSLFGVPIRLDPAARTPMFEFVA